MAQYSEYYTTRGERQAAIAAGEAKGHQMLHDNFGTGPSGENELVFDDAPLSPAPTPQMLRLAALRDKIRQRTVTLSELAEFIDLRGL